MIPELNKIYQGDCLEIMRGWPDACVDLVVTDPPYGINYQSNMRVASEKFDKIKNDESKDHLDFFREMARLLRDDSVVVSFCSWKNVADEYAQMGQFFDIKNVVVWDKGGGGIGDLSHSLSTDYELAIVGHKGAAKLRGKREGSVWNIGKVNPSSMVHPTEKPENLMGKFILQFSDEGAVVLDCFAGSGPTLLAAEKLKRNWLGIEIEPKYIEVAMGRLDAERSQGRLF